jgi:Na+/pantothenate symporter
MSTHELPVGIASLLVAAVLAATMSSIDSALYSLSTTMVVDSYR